MAKRYLGGGISFEQKDVYQEFSEDDAPSPGGSSTLAGLTDVDISNPSDGQTLVYDASIQKWVNGSGSTGGGGLYCIDTSVVQTSVTIDNVEYNEIYLGLENLGYKFYIIPANVIANAEAFYLKDIHELDGSIFTFFPYAAFYGTAEPMSDDPSGVVLGLTVTESVFVGKTEFDSDCYLIPDTAEFKTVRLQR